MREAWRIVKEKHAATAFDGEGARVYGGRWNSVGARVVYVSATKSLAALETLVHLNLPATAKYVAIPLQFNEALVETYPPATLLWMERRTAVARLPTDWRSVGETGTLRAAGPAQRHHRRNQLPHQFGASRLRQNQNRQARTVYV